MVCRAPGSDRPKRSGKVPRYVGTFVGTRCHSGTLPAKTLYPATIDLAGIRVRHEEVVGSQGCLRLRVRLVYRSRVVGARSCP